MLIIRLESSKANIYLGSYINRRSALEYAFVSEHHKIVFLSRCLEVCGALFHLRYRDPLGAIWYR
jgi:hypothetical protein